MGIGNFLLKLGKAVLKNAGDLLEPLAYLDPTGSAAAGKAVLGVAADVLDQYQQDRQMKVMRIEMEQVLAANQQELRQEIKSVVEQLAGAQAREMREQLAGYLAQVQAAMKQAARYLGDPSATTVPVAVGVEKPQELAAFLPQRPPRFRVGEFVPGRPEWQLLELLGVGGFGEVWKAENPHVGTAAFKFFLDPQACQRFATREAEVIKQVRGEGHRAGVVALDDAAPLADPPWLRFEYIGGGDLSSLPATWQNLPNGERVSRIRHEMERLARAVGHFHRLDPPVVHRDLKPSNILLRRRGAEVELLVADFGIGQILPSELNPALRSLPSPVMSTMRAYSAIYASPQQKKFLKADRRDDVYALGVIWYQLLRGDLTLERPSGEGWKRADQAGRRGTDLRAAQSLLGRRARRTPRRCAGPCREAGRAARQGACC